MSAPVFAARPEDPVEPAEPRPVRGALPGVTASLVRSAAPAPAPAPVWPSPEWSVPVVVPLPGATGPTVPVRVIVPSPRATATSASLAAAMDPVLWATTEAAPDSYDDTGHVVFRLGSSSYAVPVSDVREVIRGVELAVVPDSEHRAVGRPVGLVDAHGRTVPVVDLRSDPTVAGDVLLPVWRRHLGVAVDRVESVLRAGELVAEPADVVDALPSYARGLLRPVDGGAAVILVALPDATA